ncbi:hypothetical protein BHE90_017020 [Fusarium euwallaceae]|uniref:Uncharacterized protein n=1 Tax=Fusarium euwallaceae TaxID=1147111 RepID=A0A430KYR7_9HYPO|nr:hypothetical protein BHE90_017020 [Fusarium euwallaceae]
MANNSPDYEKKLFLQEQKKRKQAEEQRRQAEDEARLDRERNQPTTFAEFIRRCHNLLSRSLKVETLSRSTTGGKYCPTRLWPWADCLAQQLAEGPQP